MYNNVDQMRHDHDNPKELYKEYKAESDSIANYAKKELKKQ